MSKIKLKLNTNAVRDELLKGDEIITYCEQIAGNVAKRANGNYNVEVRNAGTRKYVRIEAADLLTNADNLKNNNLLKAIGKW